MRTLGRVVALPLVLLTAVTWASAQPTEIEYGPDPAQKLDLSLPAAKGFPTVIFVHGGSLETGDKADSDYGKVGDAFPSAGVACANVNYRLAPAGWPAAAEDVAGAIAWVRDNIAAHGGDPGKLFLLGHSSGATLVALVGSDERYLGKYGMQVSELRGVMSMGSIMRDDDLDRVIAARGRDQVAANFLREPGNRIYGSLEAYEDHWPIRHVHPGLPPFLFLIAESEQEQPPVLKTDQEFVEEARKSGNEASYRVFPGRKHYTMIRQLHEPGDGVFAVVLDFIRRHAG